jgi:hypothetical protein
MAIKTSRGFTLKKAKERAGGTKLPVDRWTIGRRTLKEEVKKRIQTVRANIYRSKILIEHTNRIKVLPLGLRWQGGIQKPPNIKSLVVSYETMHSQLSAVPWDLQARWAKLKSIIARSIANQGFIFGDCIRLRKGTDCLKRLRIAWLKKKSYRPSSNQLTPNSKPVVLSQPENNLCNRM